MAISRKNYQGKEVFYIDLSVCSNTNELIDSLHYVKDSLKDFPDKYLVLINLTNQFLSIKFLSEAIRLNKELFNKNTQKAAVIGISELQRTMIDDFNKVSKKELVFFEDYDKAVHYLIQEN